MLENNEKTNSINSDERINLKDKNNKDEKENIFEKKKVRFRDYSKKFTKDDFEYGKELEYGNIYYSKLYHTIYKKTGEVYITKVVSQRYLIQSYKVKTGIL
jgi:hypothetical protein